MSRNRSVQLTLDDARRATGLGGWRPGVGRPRGRTKVAHRRRDRFPARFPIHVTLKVICGLPSLRRRGALRVIQRAIAAGGHRPNFRVVHFVVLGNHLHLLVEASGMEALARGMQGLEVRFARRLNRFFERSGTFFAERYHSRILRTPTEVRGALRYVLLNQRLHAARDGGRLARDWVDPFSSAYWFDGWAEAARLREPRQRDLLNVPCPTAPATVWLLTTGWRRAGPLAFDDVRR